MGRCRAKSAADKCSCHVIVLSEFEGSWDLLQAKLQYFRPDGLHWVCNKRIRRPKQKAKLYDGRREFRTGTFFARSKLPLWQILSFAHLWVEKVALNVIEMLVQIKGSDTLVDWASFCREVLVCEFIDRPEKLGGKDMIVEIDESKFGKRKYNMGHAVEGQWVFGGYERGSGRVFMVPVDDRSADTLVPLIERWIVPGTTIYSDCWKAYSRLTELGYKHETVNHLIEFKNAETGVHTNIIESCWGSCKETMNKGCQKRTHIGGNLARYMLQKRCCDGNLDTTAEFFRLAGRVYDATKWKVGDDNNGAMIEDSDVHEEVDEYGDLL